SMVSVASRGAPSLATGPVGVELGVDVGVGVGDALVVVVAGALCCVGVDVGVASSSDTDGFDPHAANGASSSTATATRVPMDQRYESSPRRAARRRPDQVT